MKISARNVLAGTITGVKKGATTAHVTIDVKGITITASITNEAVDALGLKVGGAASAVIKSSNVLVAVDWLSVWSDFVAAWVACVERFAS